MAQNHRSHGINIARASVHHWLDLSTADASSTLRKCSVTSGAHWAQASAASAGDAEDPMSFRSFPAPPAVLPRAARDEEVASRGLLGVHLTTTSFVACVQQG
eukprot:CAMPEP_0179118302 /NCGR_PEP_ID=MMETSP0796-20121207/55623_1 /TAXON_ID=73915 /ORGANISM="Pyrodinium bahamense, Strain pbaha01" /LENGTH=101 /DNA_ID=CAMNT_0020816735 /DNA_START=154 /DNA_END=457 /DNA_ORIENTATION=-